MCEKKGTDLNTQDAEDVRIDVRGDFGDVNCPLNYVYTKLLLEKMEPGQVLAVLVNDQGCENVPLSVKNDGHEVLSVENAGVRWQIVIRKKG